MLDRHDPGILRGSGARRQPGLAQAIEDNGRRRRLLRTITDDYGAEFASHSDSLAYRIIGIYVFLRTVMCSPVRASQIAHALKLPRISVVRRLDELIKHGYVERVGNAYRVTDKVNIADLQKKLQRRIDMVAETAKRLADLSARAPTVSRIFPKSPALV